MGCPTTSGRFDRCRLLKIVERCATGFDELPEMIPAVSDLELCRTLVAAYALIGQLKD
jgi:hypothetical protein